jgi:hypothetical protein
MRFFAFIAFRLYRVTSTIRHRVRRRFTETGLVLAVAGGLALVVGADLERFRLSGCCPASAASTRR